MHLLERIEIPGKINEVASRTAETEENEDEITGVEIRRKIAKLKKQKRKHQEKTELKIKYR